MAVYYLVRHGEPDYSPCDKRGYMGHGRDLAPLSENGIKQAESTAKDIRLKSADIIVSSPYTRALQTAAIISKHTGIEIKVEMDIHEWMPDITFQYNNFPECLELTCDFNEHKGVYPVGETKRWESLHSLRTRVRNIADKYAHYDRVILVCHGMVMRTLIYAENIKPGELIECKYEIGQAECVYSFS